LATRKFGLVGLPGIGGILQDGSCRHFTGCILPMESCILAGVKSLFSLSTTARMNLTS